MATPLARPVTLFICRVCGQAKGPDGTKPTNPLSPALAEGTAALLTAQGVPVTVRLTPCLSVCSRGIAWGIRADDRYAHTFAHAEQLSPQILAEVAATYSALPPGGRLKKANLPLPVRPHLISKLPPLTHE